MTAPALEDNGIECPQCGEIFEPEVPFLQMPDPVLCDKCADALDRYLYD